MRIRLLLPICALLGTALQAQPPVAALPSFIRAVGNASVSVKPDQARIQLAVVTTAATAQDAANQNATQVNSVLSALRNVPVPDANLQTLSYSLTPNYNYPQGGGQPILTGYTASNTVQITLTDLSLIGKVIDTGIQAGANRVQGLVFGLQDDQPIRLQALKAATAQAKAHADAMASGIGVHTGAVISIQEGAVIVPVVRAAATATAGAAPTPVETGVVEVQATVTLEVALAP